MCVPFLVALLIAAVTPAAASPLKAGLPLVAPVQATAAFRQEYAVWPGPYWRGPDRPPVEVTPDDPCSWGVLRLGGVYEPGPAPQAATAEIVAPLTEGRPRVDGLLGWEEWSKAGSAVEFLDEGAKWIILAQYTQDTLYVCVASPSFPAREGQVAELYFAAATGDPLTATGPLQAWRARAGQEGRAVPESSVGRDGLWTVRTRQQNEATGVRAAAGSAGDGAWSFAVYEFAIPLAECAAEGVPVEQLALMARLQTVGRGPIAGRVHNLDPEFVSWPDHRTSYVSTSLELTGLRPDYWQPILLRPEDCEEGVCVPVATRPVRVDGQIGVKEWADAFFSEYVLPGDQWRRLWLARDDENLYIALRVHLARSLRLDENCRVSIDPCADGGLRPRGDDLQYRVPLGVETASETLRYQGDEWVACGSGEIAAASVPLSSYESTYELAVPLSSLGPDLRPKIAIEVVYGLAKAQ